MAALPFLASAEKVDESKKPNILFIFSDDHAWQAIGAYESRLKDIANTPYIDQLASEGMLFKKS